MCDLIHVCSGGSRGLTPALVARSRVVFAVVALIVLLIAGCGGQTVRRRSRSGPRPMPESALMAHLYAAALRYYGSAAHVEQSQIR